MARASDLRGKMKYERQLKAAAALAVLLDTVELFTMSKKETGILLTVHIGLFKETFSGASVWDLAQQLGEWLMKLPKGIWDDRKTQILI